MGDLSWLNEACGSSFPTLTAEDWRKIFHEAIIQRDKALDEVRLLKAELAAYRAIDAHQEYIRRLDG